jgi:hypothetical protein
MSDVYYNDDPDRAPVGITVRPRPKVSDLVQDNVAPVNPLEYLYGSPQAQIDQDAPSSNALSKVLQSAVRDGRNFFTSLATAPYRLVNEAFERPLGVPIKDDPAISDIAMEAAQWAVGGGFGMTPRGALGTAGSRAMGGVAPKIEGPFYSAVEHAISNAPQAKMTPSEWRGWLRNQPGIKAEELDFLGLGDKALHPKEWGNKPVTREQVLEHAKEHGPQIKEVEKRSEDGQVSEKQQRRAEEAAMEDMIGQHEHIDPMEMLDDPARAQQFRELTQGYVEELGGEAGGTKYHDYQLPGGDNYRELLLTLPEKQPTSSWYVDEAYGKYYAKEHENLKSNSDEVKTKVFNTRKEADDFIRSQHEQVPQAFHSSHWDEPNVLAHIRMNDRLFPSGRMQADWSPAGIRAEAKKMAEGAGNKWDELPVDQQRQWEDMAFRRPVPPADIKSLHLEEIQSDWHQQGRKKGYRPADPEAAKKARQEAALAMDKEYNRLVREHGKLTGEEQERVFHADPAYAEAVKKFHAADAATAPQGVPDAPFKSTWADLALKRAIRKAADEGYDAISWTPGAQQAERYDLSKHFQSIQVDKLPGDKYHISGSRPATPNTFEAFDTGVPANKLADVVGKDLADKIIKQTEQSQEYKGVDLKVGGEGMKGFYDKMLRRQGQRAGQKIRRQGRMEGTAARSVHQQGRSQWALGGRLAVQS